MKKLLLGFVGLSVGFFGTLYVQSLLPQDGNRLTLVVAKSVPKTVIIKCVVEKYGLKGIVTGSGVFIDKDGLILTCRHLFKGFDKVESVSVINSAGDVVCGRVRLLGKGNLDLAIVKTWAFGKTPYAEIADPKSLLLGQEVIAIGNPLDLGLSVSAGIISGLYRDFKDFAYNVTQSDTAINPGNSGGPMFNLKGEVVGIVSFIVSANDYVAVFSGVGFTVHCGQIREFITLYKKGLKK